jgi:hypothetical protein
MSNIAMPHRCAKREFATINFNVVSPKVIQLQVCRAVLLYASGDAHERVSFGRGGSRPICRETRVASIFDSIA